MVRDVPPSVGLAAMALRVITSAEIVPGSVLMDGQGVPALKVSFHAYSTCK